MLLLLFFIIQWYKRGAAYENVMISYDFKFQGLLMSPQYFQSVFFMPGKIWKAGLDVRKMPLFHLEDKEAEGFVVNYEMLKYKLSRTDMPHHQQSLKLFLQSLVYDMYDMLSPKLQLGPDIDYGYSSGEILFGRFANMLSAELPHRHNVGYYADKLCITPKRRLPLRQGLTTSLSLVSM